MPGPPLNEPGVFTVKEVHAEFEKLLRDRRHMGLAESHRETSFLEPRNPFQKKRREAEAVGGCSVWHQRCSDF